MLEKTGFSACMVMQRRQHVDTYEIRPRQSAAEQSLANTALPINLDTSPSGIGGGTNYGPRPLYPHWHLLALLRNPCCVNQVRAASLLGPAVSAAPWAVLPLYKAVGDRGSLKGLPRTCQGLPVIAYLQHDCQYPIIQEGLLLPNTPVVPEQCVRHSSKIG